MNFNKTAVVMARVVSLRSAQANNWRKSQQTAIKRFASNVANSVNGQDKTVGLWLLGCAGAVSGVVAIGGLGRLKESRFTGVSGFNFRTKPPSTDKEWEEQFKQFSSHPEYSDKAELHGKAGMTLADFKQIWRLNYYHYMALMGVPVVFFLPAALFWFGGRLSSRMQKYVMAGAGLQLIQVKLPD
jgi:heme A synthase